MASPKFNPGSYMARVTTWGLSETKHKKTPQFFIRFKPLGKINPNDPTGPLMGCPDYERTIYRVITQNTAQYVIEDLERLGYDKSSFKFLDPAVEGAHSFEGLEIQVRCDHEEYEGTLQERWNLDRDGGPLEVPPLDSKRVRQLDAMFGKSLKGNGSKKSTPAESPGETTETVPADDDGGIPF
jgi:hypothetical protein